MAPRKYQVVPKGRSPAFENQKEAVDKKGKCGRPKKQRLSVLIRYNFRKKSMVSYNFF